MVHLTHICVHIYLYTDVHIRVYTDIPNSYMPLRSCEILDVVFHETTSMAHS